MAREKRNWEAEGSSPENAIRVRKRTLSNKMIGAYIAKWGNNVFHMSYPTPLRGNICWHHKTYFHGKHDDLFKTSTVFFCYPCHRNRNMSSWSRLLYFYRYWGHLTILDSHISLFLLAEYYERNCYHQFCKHINFLVVS